MKTNVDFKKCTLAELPPGSEGVVCAVDDSFPIASRMLDLGLRPETTVRVVRRAPLGDPIELELRGYRLCLRRCDAGSVIVRRTA